MLPVTPIRKLIFLRHESTKIWRFPRMYFVRPIPGAFNLLYIFFAQFMKTWFLVHFFFSSNKSEMHHVKR